MNEVMLIIISIVILIGLFIMGIGIYNALIALKESISKAWSNIDVILKQRYDEVPQLIQICQQFVKYEKSIIDKIMAARDKMVSGKTNNERVDGHNELSSCIGGLLAIGEGYPELKSNENYIQIQNRLSDLEERLADRREFYNESVNIYNIRIQQIPDVFLAKLLGYQKESLFEVSLSEKSMPNLDI